jgi:hypothetical protein
MENTGLNPLSQIDDYGSDIKSIAVDPRYGAPEPEEDDKSLWSEAVEESWIISGEEDVDRLLKSYEGEAWQPTEDDFALLDDSYDLDQLEALTDVSTREEYEDMLSEFNETNERREWLADQGWTGTATQIGATLLDPTLWGATLAAEFGGVAVMGAQATRLGRLGRALGAAATAEAGMVGVRSQTESDYSESDMMFDFMAAMVATGAIEGIVGRNVAEIVEENTQAGIREATGPKDAGAAETKFDSPYLKYRVDDYAKRLKSGNKTAASVAQDHLQDPVLGGSQSSSVRAERYRTHHIAEANKAWDGLWRSHKEANGLSSLNQVDKARHMNKLSEQVYEARVMGIDHGPEVAKVASVIGKTNDEILDASIRAEVAGFSPEMAGGNYMIQEWSDPAWAKLQKEVDKDEFAELIYQGLKDFDEEDLIETISAKQVELDDFKAAAQQSTDNAAPSESVLKSQAELDELIGIRDARKQLALGFSNRMLSRADGHSVPVSELLDDEAGLVKWLREAPEYANMSEEEVKAFATKAFRTKAKGGSGDVIDRAKKRIQIDPKAQIVTRKGKTVRVADLMNRDAFGLHQRYVQSMSGTVAMAENGVKSPSDWKAILDSAYTEELNKRAGDKDARKKAEAIVEKLEGDRSEIMGKPRYDASSTVGDRTISLLMKHGFTTAMGKAAFSAASELGRVLSENGVRNTLRAITAFDGMFTDALRDISKGNHVVRELNEFGAAIGDENLIRKFNSFDENALMEGSDTTSKLAKAEIVAHAATQAMAKVSLLAPVDKALRLLSVSSTTNSMYRKLIQGKPTRLAFDQMGLDATVLADITRNMQAHTSVGRFGHVNKLGIEKWDRPTADAFMNAMVTNSSRQVQKALAGESVEAINGKYGRAIFQFRKFAIEAYGKHLLADINGLKTAKARVALSTMFASMFAAMGYYSRTMAQATLMEENKRDDFLKERLAEERVVANALNYTPNIGPLVTAWNVTAGTMSQALEIPVSRSSGMRNDVTAVPLTSNINKTAQLFTNLTDTTLEQKFNQARPLIPFQNTIAGDLILNSVEDKLIK